MPTLQEIRNQFDNDIYLIQRENIIKEKYGEFDASKCEKLTEQEETSLKNRTLQRIENKTIDIALPLNSDIKINYANNVFFDTTNDIDFSNSELINTVFESPAGNEFISSNLLNVSFLYLLESGKFSSSPTSFSNITSIFYGLFSSECSYCHFDYTIFYAEVSDCNFNHAIFKNCLFECDLDDCKFKHAKFEDCFFIGKFSHTYFNDASFKNCIFYEGSFFEKVNISNITIENVIFANWKFYNHQLLLQLQARPPNEVQIIGTTDSERDYEDESDEDEDEDEEDIEPIPLSPSDVRIDTSQMGTDMIEGEVRISDFLAESPTNVVIQSVGEQNYILTSHETIQHVLTDATFYKCRQATGYPRLDNVDKTKPLFQFNALGLNIGFGYLGEIKSLLNSTHQYFSIRLSEESVIAVVSKNILEHGGSWVSGNHCQALSHGSQGNPIYHLVLANSQTNGGRRYNSLRKRRRLITSTLRRGRRTRQRRLRTRQRRRLRTRQRRRLRTRQRRQLRTRQRRK